MKANTALAFILSGIALWLKQAPGSPTERAAGSACAFLALLIGLVSFVEHLTGYDFGVDQLLVRDSSTAAPEHPGRMAPATASGFILLGAALLWLDLDTARGRRPGEGLALITASFALIALAGYAYDVEALYRIDDAYSSVALHTALIFVVLSLGVLWARPDRGLMARVGEFRFRLAPQLITLVVLAVFLVGGILSAVMARQSQNTLREQIIASNLASAEVAAEFAHRYIEGTQMSVRLFARSSFIEQSALSGDFGAATTELQEFLQLNPRVNGCSIIDSDGIFRPQARSCRQPRHLRR